MRTRLPEVGMWKEFSCVPAHNFHQLIFLATWSAARIKLSLHITDMLCCSRVQLILREECRPDSRKQQKSSLLTAGGNSANCCKISQCIHVDDNVATLDGWQCGDVGFKVSRHESINPLVPSVRWSDSRKHTYGVSWSVCELFTRSCHCDMICSEKQITILKFLFVQRNSHVVS